MTQVRRLFNLSVISMRRTSASVFSKLLLPSLLLPPVRQKGVGGWVGDWNFGIPLHSRDHLSLSFPILRASLLTCSFSVSLIQRLSRQNEYPVAKPSVYTTWQCCTLFVYVSRRAFARHPSPLSDGERNVAT